MSECARTVSTRVNDLIRRFLYTPFGIRLNLINFNNFLKYSSLNSCLVLPIPMGELIELGSAHSKIHKGLEEY